MSQAGVISIAGGGGGGAPIQTLTGDSGGAVPPTGNNINIFGGPGVSVVGVIGTSTLTINMTGVVPTYVNVVGPTTYVVTATDYFISCDSTLGVINIQLPNAPTQYDQFIVKDRTGTAAINNINVTTVGGAVLIDGSATQVFNDPYDSLEMLFNGTSYEVF